MTTLEDRAMNLFAELLELGLQERAERLNEEAARDPELVDKVKELLDHRERAEAEAYLEPPDISSEGIDDTLEDFDDLTQIRYLGHGGMGVVYTAHHQNFRYPVALKMILPRHLKNQIIVELFKTEPGNMARLSSPNIVQVHHVGQYKGRPYFTMKLIDGVCLDQCLNEFSRDSRRAVALLIKVARAIHHAHQRGILHRDLKPANILLDKKNGEPIVTDLGLAKNLGLEDALLRDTELQNTGSRVVEGIVGTISYMSLEQATAGKEVTTVSDVYGLGAILYTLLTGRPPFVGKDVRETLELVRGPVKPVGPRTLNPGVDPDLQAICMKCLEKDHVRRYQSAEELARALERWLEGRKPEIEPQWSFPYQMWRWVKRNPVYAAVIVAAVILLALFDLLNSVGRLAERENQVLKSNAYTAQSVANTFNGRLQLWSSAVLREAQDMKLRMLLEQQNKEKLKETVTTIRAWYEDPASGFTEGGRAAPFASWFILNGSGKALANSETDKIVDEVLDFRDYFLGARKAKSGSVYVSRVYLSDFAGQGYKFAIAAPIYKGEKPLGVLAATVMTDSAEERLLPRDAPQKAILVGHWDGNPPKIPKAAFRTDTHKPRQRLILLHPAFGRGELAREIHNEPLFAEQASSRTGHRLDDHYTDPVGQSNTTYSGRWLAASAPVRNTEFVVIVQQEHAEAVQPFTIVGRPLLIWGGVAVVMLISVVAMIWSVRTRRRLL